MIHLQNPQLLPKRMAMLSFALLLCINGRCALADKRPIPFSNPKEQQAWNQRTRQFARLWLSRRQRNVTPQLLRMLAVEPTPYLRQHIVEALGRIEDPQALQTLRALLRQTELVKTQRPKGWRDEIAPFRVQLAIGRIKSRGLRGTQKLNTIAREVGKSWPSLKQDAQRLRLKLKERGGIYEVLESEDKLILEEFYDVLYRMGKGKENLQSLGAQEVLLWPQQAFWFQAASLSDAAEVQFWLKRAVPPKRTGIDPAHFLDLGPTAETELMRHLKMLLPKAQSDPISLAKTRSYTTLFEAAAQSRNRNFLPILRGFLKVNDRWTRKYAGDAINALERGNDVVAFP